MRFWQGQGCLCKLQIPSTEQAVQNTSFWPKGRFVTSKDFHKLCLHSFYLFLPFYSFYSFYSSPVLCVLPLEVLDAVPWNRGQMRTVVLSVEQFSNFLHDICWIVPVCSCSANGFSAWQWVFLRFYHSLLGTCLAKSVRNLRGCLNARRVSWWLAHGRSGSMLRSPGTLARAMPRTEQWHQDGSRTQSWDESLSNI